MREYAVCEVILREGPPTGTGVTVLGSFGGIAGREEEATGDPTRGGDHVGGLGTGGGGRDGEESCLNSLKPAEGPDYCLNRQGVCTRSSAARPGHQEVWLKVFGSVCTTCK